jgi:hypothetical protein
MALTIEDGTGVTNADSYASRAAFIAYALSQYGTVIADDDAADPPMRRAYAYLSSLTWNGTKTHGRGQTGAWPRTGVTDCEGIAIAADEIPQEVIDAQFELALVERATPGALSPSGSVAQSAVASERVDVIAVSYDTSRLTGSIDDLRLIVTAAVDRLSCFLARRPGALRTPVILVA